MKRTGLLLGLSTFLAGVLAAPGLAQDTSDALRKTAPLDAATLARQLDELKRTLAADLRTTLSADMKQAIRTEIDGVTQRLNTLDDNLGRDLKELRSRATTTDLNVAAAQRDVQDLRTQLLQIRQEMDGLRTRMPLSTSISAYGPSASGPAAPPRLPPTGRVRLVNTYFTPMTIVVNGAAYTLQPFGDQMIESLPAGAFTYEVLGLQPAQTRTLNPNETFVVTVYPR